MTKLENFKELGLSDVSLKALEKKGFEEPTPIQILTIPALLEKNTNLIAQAQTGTGKTAAFGLPILEKIEPGTGIVQAIILAPTRELAVQVAEEINSLKGNRKISILPVYGGQSIELQLRKLKTGVEIIVGTPGRVIDHIERGTLNLKSIKFLVLDEADEMLNMGFIDEITTILDNTPKEKNMLLFSATIPEEVKEIAKKYMKDYKLITEGAKELTTDLTEQIYFEVKEGDKFEALCRIIDIEKDFYGIVFARTKADTDEITAHLVDRGYDAEGLHGDMSQQQREKTLAKFRSKKINVLVATDVAARGIDIVELTHVINFSIPYEPESYVHRIGRTGRAGKQGTAITFVTPSEYRKLLLIQKVAKTSIKKQTLPKVKDIIKAKKESILEEINTIITEQNFKDHLDFAKDLLKDVDPVELVASLLKHSYEEELNFSNYHDIDDSSAVDAQGKVRLFVALGRVDGITPKKIVDMIKAETNVRDKNIKQIQIFDKFSFLNVSYIDAEHILAAFKQKGRGKKSLIEKAIDKK